MEETLGGSGDFFDGAVERGGVGLRWLVEAGDFAHELERGGANFVGSDGWIEIEERFDVAAHRKPPKNRSTSEAREAACELETAVGQR